jgi:cell division protein FtsA
LFKKPDTLVGLGVGTTKIAVIVAERDLRSREAVHIVGIGSAPSQGIRKGLIVNLDQAVRSVRSAVRDAENIVGFRLDQAVVSFNAVDIGSVMSPGMISLGGVPRPIEADDIERLIDTARSGISIPSNRISLHTIPIRYSIDGNFGIDDPLGMTGTRLEMDLQTVTIPMQYAHNVVNCVRAAGVEVDGLVIKPLAAALGALTEDEMRAGVISISIGGGVTGLTFYKDGCPVKIGVIPIGGDHITNDLARVLGLSIKKAEELKKRVFSAGIDDSGRAPSGNTVDRAKVLEIIQCRLEELFGDNVLSMVPDRDPDQFPAGVVLSGGVANMPEIDVLLASIFKTSVRVADPRDYYQMPPGRSDSSYVGAIGTIRYILSKERSPYKFIDPPDLQWNGRGGGYVPEEDEPVGPTFGGGKKESTMGNFIGKIKKAFEELF